MKIFLVETINPYHKDKKMREYFVLDKIVSVEESDTSPYIRICFVDRADALNLTKDNELGKRFLNWWLSNIEVI